MTKLLKLKWRSCLIEENTSTYSTTESLPSSLPGWGGGKGARRSQSVHTAPHTCEWWRGKKKNMGERTLKRRNSSSGLLSRLHPTFFIFMFHLSQFRGGLRVQNDLGKQRRFESDLWGARFAPRCGVMDEIPHLLLVYWMHPLISCLGISVIVCCLFVCRTFFKCFYTTTRQTKLIWSYEVETWPTPIRVLCMVYHKPQGLVNIQLSSFSGTKKPYTRIGGGELKKVGQ